jgi:hypothetical protein
VALLSQTVQFLSKLVLPLATVTGLPKVRPPSVDRLTKTTGTVTAEVIGIDEISQTLWAAS